MTTALAINDSSAAVQNFLNAEFGLNTAGNFHSYGCLCSECCGTRYINWPIYHTTFTVPQSDADVIEQRAAEKVIEAVRKQKNQTQEIKDALALLDGIRKLRGKA